ncbi:MAG: hypothetical protein CMA59_03495 [Euryarchaeota archaeon]|jgi:biotin carboxyl carrier protein|nr:hypothetical protein [Euryarchaeota archaeon]|tara:strand:+ start:11044 stop:11454 length:411 start_codon:yes stop_codon:yes gene_type:complete
MSEKRKVTVDGEEYEVEISPGDGNWEVSIDGRTYTVEIEGIERRAQRKRRAAKSGGASGSGIVSSAIPGKIVAIMTAEGDDVEEGSVVIVLEAMKMQNEIKAGIGGHVRKIMCKPGERVEANMPLMEITSSAEGDE